MQKLSIKTPDGHVEYRITRRNRVKKRMYMELGATGELLVVVPGHWSERQVHRILRQNVSKVERFLLRARARHVPPLKYHEGEKHPYLGKFYPMAIQEDSQRKSVLGFDGSEFLVKTVKTSSVEIHKLLQTWYRQQAQQVFTQRLQVISARADWVGERELTLKLRRMKRTWGNCSASGVIKLNTHLIKAPLPVIDSVIAHELCHLVEMNHGRAFYTLLENLNPAWKQDRQKLVTEGNLYLR